MSLTLDEEADVDVSQEVAARPPGVPRSGMSGR